MSNFPKGIFWFLFFLSSYNLIGQESVLNDDQLLFQTTPPSTMGATYGLDGVNLQNEFGIGKFNSGLLQVGDDLIYSTLEGPKLSLRETAIAPYRRTELDKEYLSFYTKGDGQSEEKWSFGRSISGMSPPQSNLIISRESTGINGGINFSPVVLISPALNVGIGAITPTEKLDVDGSARFRSVGNLASTSDLRLTSTGVLTTSASDLRLKKEIQSIEMPLEKVMKLRGISFLWKEDSGAGAQLGLIAQEVLEVVPEVVHKNGEYYGVDYSELIALLIEAIKEQQQIIENQQSEISSFRNFEKRLTQLEQIMEAKTNN